MNGGPTDDASQLVPIFPLGTVLFPGGQLPLRIFEARYVDMVGNCMRNASPFGVVPISDGSEVGRDARFHNSGTLARIDNFDQGDDGLLHILARGHERFELASHEMRGDGLVLGTITVYGEGDEEPRPEFAHLGDLLREIYASHPELSVPQPWHLDRASWIAYRLAELLPLSIEARLEILNLAASQNKLARVSAYIEAHNKPEPGAARH